jgi:hypothetical protein
MEDTTKGSKKRGGGKKLPGRLTSDEFIKLMKPTLEIFAPPALWGKLPYNAKPMHTNYGRSVFGKIRATMVNDTQVIDHMKLSEVAVQRMAAYAPLMPSDHLDKIKRLWNLRNPSATFELEQSGEFIPNDGPRTPANAKVEAEVTALYKQFYEVGKKLTKPGDLTFILDANMCYPHIINGGPAVNGLIIAAYAVIADAIRSKKYTLDSLYRLYERHFGPRFAVQFGRKAGKGKPLALVTTTGKNYKQFNVYANERTVCGIDKSFHVLFRAHTKPMMKGLLQSDWHNTQEQHTAAWITRMLGAGYEVFSFDSKGFDKHHGADRLEQYCRIAAAVTGLDYNDLIMSSFSPQMIKTSGGVYTFQSREISQLMSGDPFTSIFNSVGVDTLVRRFCDARGYKLSFQPGGDLSYKSFGDDMVIAVRDPAVKSAWFKYCADNAFPGEEEPRIAFLGKWYNYASGKMEFYTTSLLRGIDSHYTEALKSVASRRLGLCARLDLAQDPDEFFYYVQKNWNEAELGPVFAFKDRKEVARLAAEQCAGKDLNMISRSMYQGLALDEIVSYTDYEGDPLVEAMLGNDGVDEFGHIKGLSSISVDDIDAASSLALKHSVRFQALLLRCKEQPSVEWIYELKQVMKLRGGDQSPVF